MKHQTIGGPMGIQGRVPPRCGTASVRSVGGERLGRFALLEDEMRRWHRWEWLEEWWPDRPFMMMPDRDEREPLSILSHEATLPGRIRRPTRGEHIGPGSHCIRLYDVFRVDGQKRQLAVVTVWPDQLCWWELGDGGVLEILPEWLLFEPRDEVFPPDLVTRGLVQAIGPGPRPKRTVLSGGFMASLAAPVW